ncbi:UDP-2,4-diacetamido-2,4,6-trideoxy-beta-L-altropyranose hydrolase [Pseudogulbenkiania subflava]|uniref:UDP-2,4-diacetamido-2,4,6-trideoxy-beta-L-altropyranose hydrolase n=1 Tax=Pseudogulbenkiania subflava DSM 22618 TaxID=1123014 RepID=A0A1Y6BJA8_9NEIS|nr:UDP-2,4-diacetamido-2,4,6-trideoxy-beta-L-altropyranose hydrolase [Pseudogulbenkiania subflava]SMF10713.1 UDP-2,4-diacetamido-2,4,6-trideoxy-beta-L-altropyranose hydrolase [Pseudogulbenkiania subflava DSM 22618]
MKQTGKTIVFRADASLQMGTGHVMRCLTLADTLTASGAGCHFICRAHDGNLAAFIRQRGYQVHLLELVPGVPAQANPLAHAAWLGASMMQDAAETAALLSHLKPDWLVVDHYALDARWETPQRRHVARLMVIDDLADRQHDCDLLLDQNLGRTDADYVARVPAYCTCLLGPNYALLRPEFAALRPYSLQRRQKGALRTLLITMGGVDKDNATGHVLQALSGSSLPLDCRITVVMGATAPWLNEVTTLAETLPWPVDVQVNVSNMAQLMADADLAIGAAGSTSWERCCLGLPSIVICLAENQRFITNQLKQCGAALVLEPPNNENFPHQLSIALNSLVTQQVFLQDMSFSARNISAGNGTSLIVKTII